MFSVITQKSAYMISTFSPTGYLHDDNRKLCILNAERLSRRSVDDVNKWGDVMQNLCLSSVLFTFWYAKRVKIVNRNM